MDLEFRICFEYEVCCEAKFRYSDFGFYHFSIFRKPVLFEYKQGYVLVRANNPEVYGDQINDEIVNRVLLKKEVITSTEIIPAKELEKEGKNLFEQARIKVVPTPKARQSTVIKETSGMMIKSAAPIIDDNGNLIGVLYG